MNTNQEKELNLLDIILFFLKNWRVITVNLIVISILSLIIAFSLQKSYKATLTFIPPGPTGNNLFSMFGSNINSDILGGSKFSKRQYVSLLKSRELREKIIKKFNLINVYKTQKVPNPLDMCLKILDKNMLIVENEEGGLGITDIISVDLSIIDIDSNRAAQIANYAFDLLEQKTIELQRKDYQQTIDFLMSRINEYDLMLTEYRKQLKEFQLKHKVYDISNQVNMAMQNIGNLQAELNILKTNKAFFKTMNSDNYAEIKVINNKMSILQKEIDSLENSNKADILPGLKYSLDLSNEYFELRKEVETYFQLKAVIEQQLEVTRIKIKKDFSEIYLIDSARPPQYKFKPKKIIYIIGLVSVYMLFLLCFLIFHELYNKWKREKPEQVISFESRVKACLTNKK